MPAAGERGGGSGAHLEDPAGAWLVRGEVPLGGLVEWEEGEGLHGGDGRDVAVQAGLEVSDTPVRRREGALARLQ